MDKQLILDTYYNKFLKRTKGYSIIPKKIHQIWLGEVPDKLLELSKRIIDNHPDWEYKLWKYEDVESFNLVNKDLFYSLRNKGAQSDIFRYEILHRFGGVYLDTDFYMVSSFDELTDLEFFSGNGADGPEVFNGLFGCVPNHIILKNIIDKLSDLNGNLVLTINDVMSMTGPFLFADEVFNFLNTNESNSVVLPREYFYSFPATLRFDIRGGKYSENLIKQNINEKTICIHLWENSWQ